MFKEIKLTPPELVAKVLSGIDIYSNPNDLSDRLSLDENGQIRWVKDDVLLAISNGLKRIWYIKVNWRDTVSPENPVWCWVWYLGENKYNTLVEVRDISDGTTHPYLARHERYMQAEPATEEEVLKHLFNKG